MKTSEGEPQRTLSALGDHVEIGGELFYRIARADLLPPFFMMLASSSNHWLFVASNGAISCGRINADHALFPYYSADKILDMAESAGPKTVIQLEHEGTLVNWEPFSRHGSNFLCARHLYKNQSATRLIFEEQNESLGLVFRYSWSCSHEFGFVRNCYLANLTSAPRAMRVLDGLQNLLPPGMTSNFQMRFSNLGDAYKRSELIEPRGLGVYYLHSIPTDRAEPNEGLFASVAWQFGMQDPIVLLSDDQVDAFRSGKTPLRESDVRGRRGAFLAVDHVLLQANDTHSWTIVADVDHSQADVVRLRNDMADSERLRERIAASVEKNRQGLLRILSAADGTQCSGDRFRTHRHQSNVLFNVMRGGIPVDGYAIATADFLEHVGVHNRVCQQMYGKRIQDLGPRVPLERLLKVTSEAHDPDLTRLASEYLPLTFSRRHGDPTRPWNQFSIDIARPDGSRSIRYEGNWRDVFQNWEALSVSYPEYLPAMISKFVNASTMDGYNPYRINSDGFDWERPDPHDPWSNIGYWGDHQIVYLLKLLQQWCDHSPKLDRLDLSAAHFVYADVPYRIRPFDQMLKDPRETVVFDYDAEARTRGRTATIGSDGQLLINQAGAICRANLFEKLLVTFTAKMLNFVPDGGIWLNTQRPEWNDANNALVGFGVSMVTTCHLRRFAKFLLDWISESDRDTFAVSSEVARMLKDLEAALSEFPGPTEQPMPAGNRWSFVARLQSIATHYRASIYEGVSGEKVDFSRDQSIRLLQQCSIWLSQTIRSNRRRDGLFHSYNLLNMGDREVAIEPLVEMLEGQVAALESGELSCEESLSLLDELRRSRLYREDVNSFVLYPDRELRQFLEKNIVAKKELEQSRLLRALITKQDRTIVVVDDDGHCRFEGSLRNAGELRSALNRLAQSDSDLADLIALEASDVERIYENTFDHRRYMGRSTTFFAYEGLGSVYWHMVSKLGLAVGRLAMDARASGQNLNDAERLSEHYRQIREGLGVHKSPQEYGAFPIDPYSHTPKHAGAQQPGMTGQVKEDILARFVELGVRVHDGCLSFSIPLDGTQEFLCDPRSCEFYSVSGAAHTIEVPADGLAFTVCQVPVIVKIGDVPAISVLFSDGTRTHIPSNQLPAEWSSEVFRRSGAIEQLVVVISGTS